MASQDGRAREGGERQVSRCRLCLDRRPQAAQVNGHPIA
jgi:hypothetical protein